MILKILMKMKHEYRGNWSSHLTGVPWACRSSLKTTIRFSLFFLVYGTEVVNPVELAIPTPRVVLEEIQGGANDTHAKERMVDLEGLEKKREVARRQSQRYQQKMAKAYEQAVHPRIFAKGQLVLRAVKHVRKNLSGPLKFTPKWEGPYVVKETYDSGYYYLARMDGTFLPDPVNGKWLKQYYV